MSFCLHRLWKKTRNQLRNLPSVMRAWLGRAACGGMQYVLWAVRPFWAAFRKLGCSLGSSRAKRVDWVEGRERNGAEFFYELGI